MRALQSVNWIETKIRAFLLTLLRLLQASFLSLSLSDILAFPNSTYSYPCSLSLSSLLSFSLQRLENWASYVFPFWSFLFLSEHEPRPGGRRKVRVHFLHVEVLRACAMTSRLREFHLCHQFKYNHLLGTKKNYTNYEFISRNVWLTKQGYSKFLTFQTSRTS